MIVWGQSCRTSSNADKNENEKELEKRKRANFSQIWLLPIEASTTRQQQQQQQQQQKVARPLVSQSLICSVIVN